MYWNIKVLIFFLIQKCWIVTLDVLKYRILADNKAIDKSWIVTLDVLKFKFTI